jgi:hypothetical protein
MAEPPVLDAGELGADELLARIKAEGRIRLRRSFSTTNTR